MSCPICKAETIKVHRPFCSRRCADIDLGRWFSGSYAVPRAIRKTLKQPSRPPKQHKTALQSPIKTG